jgi:septal ring factor EnvC (AmiA/AmiB activator)
VLVVGTVLSLASLVGPDWALRVGVVIALGSAAASGALAWRELHLTKRRHARDLLVVSRRHTEDLRSERRHNAEVLDTVSGRAQRWRHEVDRQQTEIAGLRVEVSALRTDLGTVRRQLVRADGTIASLRESVRERDLELALVRATAPTPGAEVHTLPRRVRLERAEVDVAADGEGRTVIDLPIEEPAMPNFEADRRRA